MTLWRVGPLRIATSVDAPVDWCCEREDARRPPDLEVAVVGRRTPPADVGALAEIHTRVDGDTLHLTRAGAFTATLDLRTRRAEYTGSLDQGDGGFPLFESFLRAACASILLRAGGALLHAASAAFGAGGYVFCGLSGAGKTTLVEGTPDDVYLSDDQSIVTPTQGGLAVWGSPFSGLATRRARPTHHAVRALVLLSADRPPRTALSVREDRARAAGELLRHLCCFERTPAEGRAALAWAQRAVQTTPVFSLARHVDTPLATIIDEIEGHLAASRKAA